MQLRTPRRPSMSPRRLLTVQRGTKWRRQVKVVAEAAEAEELVDVLLLVEAEAPHEAAVDEVAKHISVPRRTMV